MRLSIMLRFVAGRRVRRCARNARERAGITGPAFPPLTRAVSIGALGRDGTVRG